MSTFLKKVRIRTGLIKISLDIKCLTIVMIINFHQSNPILLIHELHYTLARFNTVIDYLTKMGYSVFKTQ